VPESVLLMADNQNTVQKTISSNQMIKDTIKILSVVETEKHKVRFKVQIKTSTRRIAITDAMFKGLKPWRYYHQGLYKYTVGSFTDLDKALVYRNKMRQMDFSDCFVAAFDGNERITIKDAFELLGK